VYVGFVVYQGGRLTHGLLVAMVAVGGNALVGMGMVFQLRRDAARRIPLRYLGIFSDLLAATVGMAEGDEAGVPLIGIYLWVTVGNGFRYGPRFLLAAYWLSLVGFVSLMVFVPFWQTHRPIGFGFVLVLAVVPLYVLVLLSRLTAQKDAAEQLSNAKSRFVANVSHELRTPLTGVFAVHELLRMRKMTPDDRELVGMLGSAIQTLKTSVDAVLQMSKLEAGAERAEPRPFNLWYFLQQLASMVRPQATSKGLAWNVNVDPDVPCAVTGDPNHLSHVLGNLVNNAFKFTPSGSVTLRVSLTVLGRVRFEVVDTGIGIPLDQQERLFERFVQVDTSTTRRHGGTGLGTSIAHDLAELMGGRIGVVSAPGQGSTFWVELPLLPLAMDAEAVPLRTPRDVLLISPAGPGRDECVSTLQALGLDTTVCEPEIHNPPTFAANKYLAALLLMSAAEAASYAEAVLRGRAGSICPWLVLAPSYSPTQFTALQRVGAAGLHSSAIGLEDLCTHFRALESRLEAPADAAEAALPAAGVVRPLTILLADDNRSNQLLFARILEDAGHTVRAVDRGDRAFDLMAAGDLDLALLDLNMPDISGPDVVKLFRASSVGGARLPVIILSADATPAAKQESIEAGADDFLTKPVTSVALLGAIERLVAGTIARTAPVAQPRAADARNAAAVATMPPVVATSAVPPSPHPAAAPVLVDTERIQ
jgi:two-component system sensor histidine kinase RpfC